MKTILVTGDTGGMGSAIVKALSDDEIQIIPIGKSPGSNSQGVDLASHKDVKKLSKIVGEVDWIVCAHGFIDTATSLESQSLENIAKTFDVNTFSIIYLIKYFLKNIRPGGGVIVLSSTAGIKGNGHYAVYSASKAAINNLMQAMARNKPELTFIALAPGPTNTPMREKIAHDATSHQDPTIIAALIKEIIQGKSNYKSGDIVIASDGKSELYSNI